MGKLVELIKEDLSSLDREDLVIFTFVALICIQVSIYFVFIH